MDIGEKIEAINPTLTKIIWKGYHPKKTKFFLWEISRKTIITSENLQIVLHGPVSKLVSIMRERKRITKPLIYAIHMHSKILDNDSQYIRMASHIFLGGKGSIGYGLNVPPFKNAKFLQWKNLVMAFFWNLWKERNQRIFTEETQIYTKLFNNVVYQGIS